MNRARAIVLIGILGITTSSAQADELRNGVFNVQLDASGIKSLRRTNDTYDTEYIAANGTLGRLLIRYRTTRNGDWRELRELLPIARADGRSASYAMAVPLPTLSCRP